MNNNIMKCLLIASVLFSLIVIQIVTSAEQAAAKQDLAEFVHHDLKVVLYPEEHRFTAEDKMTLPENFLPEFSFFMHKGLNPHSPSQGITIRKEIEHGISESYRVKLPPGSSTFVLKYGGVIDHPVEQYGKEQARGFSQTEGIISSKGVYLAGSSYWYPRFSTDFLSFTLEIELPPAWDAVSQGARTGHIRTDKKTVVKWDSPEPQEEIFLTAGKFTGYTKTGANILAMVFLRAPDKGLADRYLDATVRYIKMYDKLIGDYPYKKFALVENFWETGFGMPSFTLLGPKIIRFPFIISSSYPHEILHNWWGNSVFPDYEKGNWSEGLTAYLSDHFIKEQQGEGAEYRQTTLQKYTDFVLSGRDFPLTEFRSRHSSSSEAIGYGKSLMFFHMLRLKLGDNVFIEGLQDFYRKNKFKIASFADLRKSFEFVSKKDLKTDFDRWITIPGAPQLKISKIGLKVGDSRYILNAGIEQMQSGNPYSLRIPVAITMEGRERAYQTVVDMNGKRAEFTFILTSRPLRMDVDPEFDVFRRLDRDEVPPAISQALGARKMLVLLPSAAGKPLLQAYRGFAKALINSGPDEVEIRLDNDLQQLPSDRAVTVIGWENRFFDKVSAALSVHGVKIIGRQVHIGKNEIPKENHSIVLTARSSENKDMAIMFVASDLSEALPGLSRKLPHYSKYSYLVFKGNEPENREKGRWPVLDSPMTVFIPGDDGTVSGVEMGKLEQRRPLVTLPAKFSSDRMMETIRFLSSEELKGRGMGTEGLERAAEYIAEKFHEEGLIPAGDEEGSYFQTWEEAVPDSGHKVTMKNVIGVIPGKKSQWDRRSVVIGAHYDHLGFEPSGAKAENTGKIFPGADDNASGVAVLIELVGMLRKSDPERSVVFIAFTGEETGKIGSKYYIKKEKRYPADQCIGMLNLDTVGRLGDKKLLVLGTGSAKEWAHIFRGAGYVTGVDVEAVSEELDSSDQKSFQDAGIPAVQLFSGPHPDYHRTTDTFDKIDPEGLGKVAIIAKEVIEHLAGREKPLTFSGKPREKESSPKKERKVSLGIIPDFAYSGNGCRISGVVQGSPVEAAGLKEGDIIIRINSAPVHKLKDLSDILKSLNPGDRVSIFFLREGKEMKVDAGVVGR